MRFLRIFFKRQLIWLQCLQVNLQKFALEPFKIQTHRHKIQHILNGLSHIIEVNVWLRHTKQDRMPVLLKIPPSLIKWPAIWLLSAGLHTWYHVDLKVLDCVSIRLLLLFLSVSYKFDWSRIQTPKLVVLFKIRVTSYVVQCHEIPRLILKITVYERYQSWSGDLILWFHNNKHRLNNKVALGVVRNLNQHIKSDFLTAQRIHLFKVVVDILKGCCACLSIHQFDREYKSLY